MLKPEPSGASSPTQALKARVLSAPYAICIERARYYTRVYARMQGEHPALVAAHALSETLGNMTLYILPEERLAGNRSSKILGAVIPVERGEINLVLTAYLDSLLTRKQRPFSMDPDDRREFVEEILPFWRGRTVRDYKKRAWKAAGLLQRNLGMNPLAYAKLARAFGAKNLKKSLAPFFQGDAATILSMRDQVTLNNPNLVNNVFDVQGHLTLGIANLMDQGMEGVHERAKEYLKNTSDPESRAFYQAVMICCRA
ncbi:MAG: hypothetical protein JRI97_13190, partial [Deltaproteobacteria bacterium]|nr:hypothetical protein [Deltaproteobacteria bacterium]